MNDWMRVVRWRSVPSVDGSRSPGLRGQLVTLTVADDCAVCQLPGVRLPRRHTDKRGIQLGSACSSAISPGEASLPDYRSSNRIPSSPQREPRARGRRQARAEFVWARLTICIRRNRDIVMSVVPRVRVRAYGEAVVSETRRWGEARWPGERVNTQPSSQTVDALPCKAGSSWSRSRRSVSDRPWCCGAVSTSNSNPADPPNGPDPDVAF
ncbi:hypothetical protein R1flu_011261 [Riccia fluitans]|uniref:Uncharacterized protein n=1 Tax=Riccia fluitans TaxID=41844 RepID=A0ABD1Z8E6_9MARC